MGESVMRLASENQRSLPRRFAFTVHSLMVIACPAGKPRVWVYDSRVPGLAMMVTSNGAKAFYLYKKIAGRPERIRLGGFPDITIEQARTLAAKRTGEIANGINPAAQRKAERQEITLGELWAWYLPNHLQARNRSWKVDEYKYEKHLAGWKGRKLASIAKADVVKLHNRIGAKHPTGANRILALLRTMYVEAKDKLDYAGIDPTEGIKKFPENKRTRYLGPDELAKFKSALEDEQTLPEHRDFFALLLLTGVRKGNLLTARWDEINLDTGTFAIPASKSKSKKPMTVSLSPDAIAIFKSRLGNGSEWVFPGPGESGHLVEVRKPWANLCKRAGLSDLHPHDLRHTLASWMTANNVSLKLIAQQLGHLDTRTTERYAHVDLSPVRAAVNAANISMTAAAHNAQQTAQAAAGATKE